MTVTAISKAAPATADPENAAALPLGSTETLPGLLHGIVARQGRHAVFRHKRGGIWHERSFSEHADQVGRFARVFASYGVGPDRPLITIGENRPELYAAVVAAQALAGYAAPLSIDFLERYGAPGLTPALILCDGENARLAAAIAPGWARARVLTIPELDEATAVARVSSARAPGGVTISGDTPALLVHTRGVNGPPSGVLLSHAALISGARETLQRFGVSAADEAMAFLPMSDIHDASVSIVQPLLAGFCVNCVEGPSTFAIDLKDVAPTYLVAPARAFELIDRDVRDRLSAAGSMSRALQAAARRGLPGSRLLFAAPLLNGIGLGRCRIAIATGEILAPDAEARLRSYGVPIVMGRLETHSGGRFTDHDASNGSIQPTAERTPGTRASDSAVLPRIEALLRGYPEIERALAVPTAAGVSVRLALDTAAVARLVGDRQTARSKPETSAAASEIHDLIQGRIDEINALLTADPALQAHVIVGFEILPHGFSSDELTLDGAVRRQTTTTPFARPISARATSRRQPAASETVLDLQDVNLAFGGVHALAGVSLSVTAGEILSIIGPNGAGKTSLLNVINGLYRPTTGTITFRGKVRTRMRASRAALSGIGRTFQHVSLFGGMSVLDNLLVGRSSHFKTPLLSQALRLPSAIAAESTERIEVERILTFLDLEHIRRTPVSTLPYGVQKRVELGRALATEPRLLLLDEPMAGMTQEEKREMCRFIRAVNESFGTTIVLIEHDIGVVMGLSDRVIVLNHGRKIADDTPAAVARDPEVIAAYLGSSKISAAGI